MTTALPKTEAPDEWLIALFAIIDNPAEIEAAEAQAKAARPAPEPSRYVTCPKCMGGQKFYQFRHVSGGICFRCNGAGVISR